MCLFIEQHRRSRNNGLREKCVGRTTQNHNNGNRFGQNNYHDNNYNNNNKQPSTEQRLAREMRNVLTEQHKEQQRQSIWPQQPPLPRQQLQQQQTAVDRTTA
jgi:hypothetical protein